LKRIIAVILCSVLLAGCATYKFQRGKSPYDTGYVVWRNNEMIPEYTLGQDNTVPQDLALAKERFNRRRKQVEYFYNQMGYLKNSFRQVFLDPPTYLIKLVIGVFRLPFIAVSQYRASHNPAYRERLIKLQQAQDLKEELRLNKLKEQLRDYIQKDIAWENSWQQGEVRLAEGQIEKESFVSGEEKQDIPKEVKVSQTLQQLEEKLSGPNESESKKEKRLKVAKPVSRPKVKSERKTSLSKAQIAKDELIKAVIVARPKRGYSPLKVRFDAGRSFSRQGRIIAYLWDFGDGDTSTKRNPTNTFWSVTYGVRRFVVKLTVNDDKGNSATAEEVIEVETK